MLFLASRQCLLFERFQQQRCCSLHRDDFPRFLHSPPTRERMPSTRYQWRQSGRNDTATRPWLLPTKRSFCLCDHSHSSVAPSNQPIAWSMRFGLDRPHPCHARQVIVSLVYLSHPLKSPFCSDWHDAVMVLFDCVRGETTNLGHIRTGGPRYATAEPPGCNMAMD